MENMPAIPTAATSSMRQLRTRKLDRKLFTISFSWASLALMSSSWFMTINTPAAMLISSVINLILSIMLFAEARELYRRLS